MDLIGELEAFLTEYKREIREEAAAMWGEALPPVTEELFGLFERTGSRIPYERVYFGRRKFLAVYGMTAYLERQEEGAPGEAALHRLAQVMEDICGEECWALPAHVNRGGNPDWRVTVDLFAAETAQTLTDLVSSFGKELPRRTVAAVEEQVEKRVLRPFFSSRTPYLPWENAEMNWNAVCAGSIGSICLHLLEGKELEKCLNRVCASLPHYLKSFARDGACMEGLTYFTYGMTYFVNFARELFAFTGGERDLLRGAWAGMSGGKDDLRARIAGFQRKCYFPDGRTVSFSDGSSRERFRVGLSCALALAFPEAVLPCLSRAAGLNEDSCYRFAALKMDLLVTQEYLLLLRGGKPTGKPSPDKARDEGAETSRGGGRGEFIILPDAQWCVGRAVCGAGMACKGGHNGEPHNHNDVGHFLYEAYGVMFLTDLGAGEYTAAYFGEGRYDILCNSSLGHSVPIIDGEGQLAGGEHCCALFEAGGDGRVIMELKDAYRSGLLESLRRSFVFDKWNGGLQVEDTFVLPEERESVILESLITQLPPKVEGARVFLQEGEVCAVLTLEDAEEDPRVEEFSHRNHQGRMEKVYAIRWPVGMKGRTGTSTFRIFCIPSPAAGKKE